MRRKWVMMVVICAASSAWARGPEKARQAVKQVIGSGTVTSKDSPAVVGRIAVVEGEPKYGQRWFRTWDAKKGREAGEATYTVLKSGRLVKYSTTTFDGKGGWRQSYYALRSANVSRRIEGGRVQEYVQQGRDARGRFTPFEVRSSSTVLDPRPVEPKPMSKADYLRWAKDRAQAYLDRGDARGAVRSMVSDLGKSEHFSANMGFIVMMGRSAEGSAAEAKRFVEGF